MENKNKYVGAIDAGTTSVRFILFNKQGEIISSAQKEHQQIFPKPGWVEHDPLEIWLNCQFVIQTALQKASIKSEEVAALGITNQRETVVAWNKKTGIPIYNAIVWQDTRTEKFCQNLRDQGYAELIQQKTGLPPSTYFSAAKMRWILDNIKEAKNCLDRQELLFGTMDSWILWNLNGAQHFTDVTNASRTQLMNLENLVWDEELLKIFEVPRQTLPEIVASSSALGFGSTLKTGPLATVLPICGVLGDQQAALFGQTCFTVGESKNTYGTGAFMLLNTGHRIVKSRHGMLSTLAYQLEKEAPVYALEGSVAYAGSTMQWLRDNMGFYQDAKETEELALSVADNGGCYLVPAFSGLFAPHWRSDARGLIVGLSSYTNKNHIVRAALESICYQTFDVLEAMTQDSNKKLKILRVDGGACANNFLMQFQADILQIEVERPKLLETTCLGAAYAAGLAVGFWKDLDSLKENWQLSRRWLPSMALNERDRLLDQWQKAVTRSLDWL